MSKLQDGNGWRRFFGAAPIITILLMIFALSPGCGGEQEAALDSQLEDEGTVSVEQGLAQIGEPVFNSADLPVAAGTRLEYLANAPGSTTPVRFDLEGPWDLTAATTAVTMTAEYIDRADGPLDDDLPDADLVIRYYWDNGVEPTEYVYQSLDESAWHIYGRSDQGGGLLELEGTSRALLFPMATGDRWTDNYTENSNGDRRAVVAEHAVLALNEVKVPAGTYNAFLVQTRVTESSPEATTTAIVYTWFAPGAGRVAEIVSIPGETDELFTTARSFYRLKDFREA